MLPKNPKFGLAAIWRLRHPALYEWMPALGGRLKTLIGVRMPSNAGWNPLNWSIENRVLAGFLLVFAMLLVIAGVSYRNTDNYLKNTELDARSRETLQFLALTLALVENADLGVRRYLVTGEEAYLSSYHTATQRAVVYLEHLEEITPDTPVLEEQLGTLKRLIEKALHASREAIALRSETDFEGARHLLRRSRENPKMGEIRQVVQDMERQEKLALKHRAQESTASTRSTIVLLSIGTVLQFLLLSSVYYLIRHDIHERRRVASELEHRGEQLEAANKELEAFSYSVSHDLRAPLRHIDGYVGLLEKSVGSELHEKAARYLKTIADSAKEMGRLIDELLVFSRMGRAEMANTPVHLDLLVKDVLKGLHHETQNRAISWVVGRLPMVRADPSMLRLVLVNLLSNAVKFTARCKRATIEVGSRSDAPGEVVVFVRDNGVGFDMQYVQKLFGVFQRLHRAEDFEGTGIGLANVRRIIHRHGGRTWAEGVLNGGATFYFSLPIHGELS